MGKHRKLKRCAKAARRSLKAAASVAAASPKSKSAVPRPRTVDEQESTNEKARLTRLNEMAKRNAAAQQLPRVSKRRKTTRGQEGTEHQNLEADQKAFFAAIDSPLYRVCGSCGELANATTAVRRLYDPATEFFFPRCKMIVVPLR